MERGVSLVEVLVATALGLLAAGAALSVVDAVRAESEVQIEAGDLEQRVRIAALTLSSELKLAGAGLGADGGSPPTAVAPVLPYRAGRLGADAPGTFRRDVITVVYVPLAAPRAILSAPISSGQLTLRVTACLTTASLCGFAAGMTILVSGESGRYDLFRIESATATEGRLTPNTPAAALVSTYEVGSRVTQVVGRTFAIKPGAEAGTRQVVVYEGSTGADAPVVDHVVGLSFEYLGIAGPAGTEMADEGSNLVWLSPERLSDGDLWRPDAGAPNRFDADLLRIRAVDVTVRVESALDALRGPAGPLFARAGTAHHGRRFLPDRQVRFRVSPPNLSLAP